MENDNHLKSKIQSHSDEELIKIYEMKDEYTPEAIQYVIDELNRRDIAFKDIKEEHIQSSEQNEKIIGRENWFVIISLLAIPFVVLYFGDPEIAQRAGRKIVPAIACLAVYGLYTRLMVEFSVKRRFTHFAIIYFIIWLILMIISS